MAVEVTLVCDGCGTAIATAATPRAARAEAQLQCGAYCGPAGDWCVECRRSRAAEALEARTRPARSHSAGQCR